NAMILLDTSGALPVSAQFESPADGPVMFVLSGTAWTQNAGNVIGLNLFIDGQGIGNTAMCYANENASHMAMRTTFITFDNLSPGTHTIEILPYGDNTVTDQNDYYQVTLFY
ncbi:MAG TPA: hypothetical protein VNB22_07510, partial [Pyrinomonadaceae bacterium]|nr:hypothetical protein [Pyrinomonadaceae bacterium]